MTRIMGTYTLKYPIIRETRGAEGDEREEELKPAGFAVTLKRPRSKDLRVMDAHDENVIAGSIALLARISDLTDEEVELLDGEDFGELGKLLGASAPAGQPIGPSA